MTGFWGSSQEYKAIFRNLRSSSNRQDDRINGHPGDRSSIYCHSECEPLFGGGAFATTLFVTSCSLAQQSAGPTAEDNARTLARAYRPISVYRLDQMPIQSCGQSVKAPRGKAGARLNALTELRAKHHRSAWEVAYRNRLIANKHSTDVESVLLLIRASFDVSIHVQGKSCSDLGRALVPNDPTACWPRSRWQGGCLRWRWGWKACRCTRRPSEAADYRMPTSFIDESAQGVLLKRRTTVCRRVSSMKVHRASF